MQRSTKDGWLSESAGDLITKEVEDVPVKGESVMVRGLPAAYSNQAASEALELKTVGRGDQIASVNTDKLERLQFQHGVIEPTFTAEEVDQIAKKFGPAFKKVVEAIDEISGIDKEAIKEANARFQSGGKSSDGARVDSPDPGGAGGS